MEFEWDSAKDRENRLKHGISFEASVDIWDGTYVNVERVAYAIDGEWRSATIGWIGAKLYVAIWTGRGTKIRLISVRRARPNEEKVFGENVRERP